jgi:HopA1 effector protein family
MPYAALDCLRDSIHDINLMSPTSYTIAGVRQHLSAQSSQSPGTAVAQDVPIVLALANDIYLRKYAKLMAPKAPSGRLERLPFLAALSAANASIAGWDGGWSLERRLDDRDYLLQRDGFFLRASAAEIEPDPGTAGAQARYSVNVGKEQLASGSGWYVAFGNVAMRSDTSEILTRLYWNVTPHAAARLVRALTQHLNDFSVAFKMKLPAAPDAYDRVDTAVLYLAKCDYLRGKALFSSIHRGLSGLRSAVPVFTKSIAPGLGVAEDPGNGLSFGQHRCLIVARALWRAFMDGEDSPAARMNFLEQEFCLHGLDCAAPHLGPNSDDVYERFAA